MSRGNVEIVEEIHRRLNARESTRGLVDENLEYVNPPDAIETGTLHGHSALRKVLEVYPDFRFDVERVVDAGDDVVVVGLVTATSPSGVPTEDRQVYVWTVKHGHAVRFRWFRDSAQAFQAVGLDE